MKQALSLNEMVDEQNQQIFEVCRVQVYPGQNSQQASAVRWVSPVNRWRSRWRS